MEGILENKGDCLNRKSTERESHFEKAAVYSSVSKVKCESGPDIRMDHNEMESKLDIRLPYLFKKSPSEVKYEIEGTPRSEMVFSNPGLLFHSDTGTQEADTKIETKEEICFLQTPSYQVKLERSPSLEVPFFNSVFLMQSDDTRVQKMDVKLEIKEEPLCTESELDDVNLKDDTSVTDDVEEEFKFESTRGQQVQDQQEEEEEEQTREAPLAIQTADDEDKCP